MINYRAHDNPAGRWNGARHEANRTRSLRGGAAGWPGPDPRRLGSGGVPLPAKNRITCIVDHALMLQSAKSTSYLRVGVVFGFAVTVIVSSSR
ncbi:hypothetical protein BaRGS_00007493 [Batillaria attramentaria]|uniref:Uncharacterized protein n=1 Tax=Batillaria attramentaria TaxID=370345 RepID=A0ABD0LPG2_9CAEN